jgi:Predicted aminoglycoside phosphotransferase
VPYVKLDIKTAEKLMHPVKPRGRIKGMYLIREGLRNSNYMVEYDDSTFLLRLYGADDDWWEKEEAVFQHAANKVRVPELYYLDGSLKLIGKPYSITEFIDGITLDKYLLQQKYDSEVIEKIGEGLALIHETRYSEVGFLDKNLDISIKLPCLKLWYNMFLTENVIRKLGDELTEAVRSYIENNDRNIGRIEQRIAFVHNDFRPINIIVDNSGSPCFIDWEGSMAGHAIGDIGQFLRINEQVNERNEKLFIDSYNHTAKDKLPDDYKKLARLRDLVNLLQMLNTEYNLKNKDRDLIKLIGNTCINKKML